MGKIRTGRLFAALGIVLSLCALLISKISSNTLQDLAANASARMENKLNACENALQKALKEGRNLNKEEFYNLYASEKIGVYLVNGKDVLFWNNAQIPIIENLSKGIRNKYVADLRQGFFLFQKVKNDSLLAFSLCLIKSQHDIQNNYLRNDFSEWLEIPKEVGIDLKTGTTADVKAGGISLFSLKGNETSYNNKTWNALCISLFAAGLFLFFLSLVFIFKKNPSNLNAVLVLLPLLVLRLLMFMHEKPAFLVDTVLYNVQVFGSSDSFLNAHLADVLFNATALLYVALVFYFFTVNVKNRSEKNIKLVLLFAMVFVGVWQFNHSISSLVSNSTMSFDFLNVFNIRDGVIISLLSIVFNCIALFIFLYRAASLFNKGWGRSITEFMLCNAVVCLILYLVSPGETFFHSAWLMLFSLLLFLMVKLQYQRFSLALGMLTAVMSAITAGFLNYHITRNEKQKLPIYADKLSERQDTYLENEFTSLPEKIRNDKNLQALLSFLPESKQQIVDLLNLRYFRGYFSTYDVEFSMFDPNCKPLLEPSQAILLNEGFFEDRIREWSDSTSIKELFYAYKYRRNTQYISKIKLGTYSLYVLMDRKKFEELGSFPDLLLDQSQQKSENLKQLSHAVYRDDQRTSKYGDFNYPFYYIDSLRLTKSSPGWIHHYFHTDEITRVVISEKIKSWRYFFTYNSYVFLFFSVICFVCYFLYAILFTANFKTASLTRRIQTIIIILLLLAMTAVGITSGNLVTKQFENDNVKQLQEKAQTIISELIDQFKKPEELFSDPQKEKVNLKLQEFSHLYNSDISLFNSGGALFNTSQPKLYELGLAAKVSNPKAYFNLKDTLTSAITVTEKAGSLNYLSLYTPIFNEKKEFIGFVNLPYFARQSDLTNELSNIISALINVYIILFVISIIAGLILAGYITKPLRLIKQQISNITLGKQNETLKWESNDEVGKLVTEYNNMLMKLEHSANLLAQSERESAWREMAKQVAHEIKNPLTPMKLNLQYLQHVMKSNPDDFREKFEKASSSIIEQIDTLARIATEFSNFAKLPGTQLKEINLLEIIRSSVNLFEQEKKTPIEIHIPFGEINVLGDKEQALRVFNNILKNAIQATQETEKPVIRISAEENDDSFVIRISDNGVGIADSMREKIFTPNFTTKSTGSGLGLAMVKSIMSNFGGKIWFESAEGQGSTFFIEFRKAKLNQVEE